MIAIVSELIGPVAGAREPRRPRMSASVVRHFRKILSIVTP